MDEILLNRSECIVNNFSKKGTVAYWMSRDQRVHENWAFEFARQLAKENSSGIIVVFCLTSEFLGATFRQYGFMIRGLQKVESQLKKLNISFVVLTGLPEIKIPEFCAEFKISHLVTDFDPLKIKRYWLSEIVKKVDCSVFRVDAHNIVPAFKASGKIEFGAYTLRPKINKLLPYYLNAFPELSSQSKNPFPFHDIKWVEILENLQVNYAVKEVTWCVPGEDEGKKMLQEFLSHKLDNYAIDRNNPLIDATSNLSPYLHFGQIAAQYVAAETLKADANPSASGAFLEELIIRRELADNFCYYNPNYDSFEGFPLWAKETLNDQRQQQREFIYSPGEFEKAQTHDDLWNAAQMEMVIHGKMHGYMRMYWAKKILEWSASPEESLEIAIFLNDKYELDGRDPNGYAGCAWSIGGVHDRAWNSRPVFGKIRYMNYNGCKRKFDVKAYIKKFKASNEL